MMENVMQDSRKRNLDKRRETSRYAARDRRGKEADIFVDLRDVVPIVDQTTVTHVDRIALLRVAATLCRMRSHIGKSLQAPLQPKADEVNLFTEDTITECLDGFIMIIDMDGQVLYVTESVTFYLGITQTDMVGRFLRDFTNQKDYESYMRDIQEGKSEEGFSARVLRMKSVISPRGRTLNLKSAVDKPVWVCYRTAGTGNSHHVYMQCATNPAGTSVNMLNTNGIAMKNGECTTGTGMTRHTCDMKITYVSENMGKLVQANNYRSNNLVGVSFYDLVHPADAMRVSQWISEVFVKTSCRTSFYRILGAAKNVIWVQTEAVIMNHTLRGKKGQYIICTHHFLGIQTDASSAESVKLGLTCGTLPVVIKQEVDDYPDFVGIEPRVVDCLDFTPLVPNESRVPPRMQINIDEFTPMRADGNFARPASPTQFQQQGQNLRKSSYDDVLQWLFRDHPDSPAPFSSRYDENLQSSQDDQDGNEFDTMRQQREQPFIGEDPPLTVSTFYDPSRKQSLELPRGCGNDQAASFLRYQRQNHANSASPASAMGERLRGSHGSSPLSSNGSARGPTEGASPMEWSPLAAGIADCNLRSPVENCINRSLAANPSAAGVPFMPRMRAGNTAVPTISQADGYNLVPGTNAFRAVGAGSLPRAAVYANVPAARAEAPIVRSSGCSAAAETSAACSGVRRSFGQFEPQQFVTVTASGPQQPRKPSSHNNPNNTINFPQQTTDGSMHKSPMDYSQLYVDCQDNLQSLAPFVADEEMFQLTNTLPADLQGLFSDDPSDEWMNSFGPINAGIDGSGCGNVMGMRNNNFMSDRLY